MALGNLGYNLATGDLLGPDLAVSLGHARPSNQQLADAYTKATGRQWLQQIGATAAVFEVGLAALKASRNPKSKAAVAKAFKTLVVARRSGP